MQIFWSSFQQKIFFFTTLLTFYKVILMNNQNNLGRLQQQLCELKLEERRVSSDIKHLVRSNATIDFFQAKQLNSLRTGVKRKIKSVEAKIMPNIIA